jgi:hypothetical protein
MARKKRSHIFSDFNTPESAFSLFENAIRVAMDYDAGVSDSFTAKVLTRPTKLTRNPSTAAFSVGEQDSETFAFMVRILGENSPHKFLPDPCAVEYTKTPESRRKAFNLIQKHTKVAMNVDSTTDVPQIDDLVTIILDRNEFGTFKIDQAKQYVSIFSRARGPGMTNRVDCQNLGDSFAQSDIINGGLPPTEFTRYDNSIASLDPACAPKFGEFFGLLAAAGYTPVITSTRRSVKHQWNLYTGRIPAYTPAAPCYSDHQYGFAMDINVLDSEGTLITGNDSMDTWAPIIKIAQDSGLRHQGASDKVHFFDADNNTKKEQLKQKCIRYYYDQLGSKSRDKKACREWPENFIDLKEAISGETSGYKIQAVLPENSST